MPVFDYLAQHPEEASHFSEAMVGFHGAEPPAVAEAYDFSAFKVVVDVGGATGNMLAAILSGHTGPRGVLFDRPHVVRDAPALLQARGVEARVTIEAGDFFETVPAGRHEVTVDAVTRTIRTAVRRRRLPVVTHHPRLERGSVSLHPRPLPQSHQARWSPLDRRDGVAGGRHAASGQDAGHGHAGSAWWPGTHRGGIRSAAGQSRLSPESRGGHGVGRERGGSSSGLTEPTQIAFLALSALLYGLANTRCTR